MGRGREGILLASDVAYHHHPFPTSDLGAAYFQAAVEALRCRFLCEVS